MSERQLVGLFQAHEWTAAEMAAAVAERIAQIAASAAAPEKDEHTGTDEEADQPPRGGPSPLRRPTGRSA